MGGVVVGEVGGCYTVDAEEYGKHHLAFFLSACRGACRRLRKCATPLRPFFPGAHTPCPLAPHNAAAPHLPLQSIKRQRYLGLPSSWSSASYSPVLVSRAFAAAYTSSSDP